MMQVLAEDSTRTQLFFHQYRVILDKKLLTENLSAGLSLSELPLRTRTTFPDMVQSLSVRGPFLRPLDLSMRQFRSYP